jgi:hypothetical protein
LTEKQVDKWKERYGGVPPVQFCHKCVWEGVPEEYEFCQSANTKRIECALLEKVSMKNESKGKEVIVFEISHMFET